MSSATLRGGAGMTAYLANVGKALDTATELDAGFLPGPSYSDGTPVAQVAADNDYGAPARGVPPRPFFRNMVAAQVSTLGAELAKRLAADRYRADNALDDLGYHLEDELRRSIINTNTPPNSPATIARKGSNKPLIDTGLMIASISHRVK